MPGHEGEFRHRIGLEKILWGSDYPHLEGTWPNTREYMHRTFENYPEDEIRDILGRNALHAYGFDPSLVEKVANEIGPSLADIRGSA
jgi:predicted TIM-barrel fold metal-dependent hydrolase